MLGIQTAMNGGVFPLTAKVDDIVWNNIYEKLSANPIPKQSPIPPFTLRAERETPITVRINAAKDMAIRW